MRSTGYFYKSAWNHIRPSVFQIGIIFALLALAGCGGNNSSADQAPISYSLSGTISGLTADGLVINNNGASLHVTSGATGFSFGTFSSGTAYAVTISTQPLGLKCSTNNDSGTLTSNVANVQISCVPITFTLGGTISGLTVSGLILDMNGNQVTLSSGTTSFSFGTFNYGTQYRIIILGQPSGLKCVVNNGTGTLLSDIGNVQVSCVSRWVWMSGSKTNSASGVYGIIGTAASNNVPGARYAAVSWTDSAGNLWLFGGWGIDANGGSNSTNDLNDLWMYNSITGMWRWVSGSKTINAAGVYGTLGAAAADNVPSARFGSVSWTDSAGNLWLFGGQGIVDSTGHIGYLNDLWVYSLSTGMWTWMSGSNTPYAIGVYGTQGVAAPDNVPGARWGAISWTDSKGNLWLYGGHDGNFYDLWMYTPSTGMWTWMNGASITHPASFDSALGPRQNSVTWTDSADNLWLFGGYSADSAGRLNDLWMYSTTSNAWTLVSASTGINASGVFGTQGVPSPNNIPGARYEALSWTDRAGNFWLFGGAGTEAGTGVNLSDLWKYNPTTHEWTWVSGSNNANVNGTYGTLGLASIGAAPGARSASIGWVDISGNLWLFGGVGLPSTGTGGPLNDMWKYSP